MEIEYKVAAINAQALDYDLKTALGAVCSGFVYDGEHLRLVMDDKATASQILQAGGIIVAHDPSKLSDAQLKEIEQVAALERAREQVGDSKIDENKYGDNNLLAELAKHVAWLELEVRQLRGL